MLGIDWDKNMPKIIDPSHIMACSPNMDTTIYSRATMTVPVQRYQRQRWIPIHPEGEAAVCTLLYRVTGPPSKVVGRVMVGYSVTLQGTRMP